MRGHSGCQNTILLHNPDSGHGSRCYRPKQPLRMVSTHGYVLAGRVTEKKGAIRERRWSEQANTLLLRLGKLSGLNR